jgi:short-subunit dehydrogenase
MVVDLDSFESIRNFVSEFNQKNVPLDVLINNAGMHPYG